MVRLSSLFPMLLDNPQRRPVSKMLAAERSVLDTGQAFGQEEGGLGGVHKSPVLMLCTVMH